LGNTITSLVELGGRKAIRASFEQEIYAFYLFWEQLQQFDVVLLCLKNI